MLHDHGSPKPTTCFSNMKKILHLHLGALRKSEKEKGTKLTTTRSWTILCPLCKCKNIDQLVLQTPSFPWVTLKLAKESMLTPKANNALLEHLVWKLHRFPSWSNVQIHICFYPELVHTMFTSPFILRVYPVGFARSLLNLYEKHVGAKPGRTSRNWRVGPTLWTILNDSLWVMFGKMLRFWILWSTYSTVSLWGGTATIGYKYVQELVL